MVRQLNAELYDGNDFQLFKFVVKGLSVFSDVAFFPQSLNQLDSTAILRRRVFPVLTLSFTSSTYPVTNLPTQCWCSTSFCHNRTCVSPSENWVNKFFDDSRTSSLSFLTFLLEISQHFPLNLPILSHIINSVVGNHVTVCIEETASD